MLRRCFHLLPTRNIHVTRVYNVRLCIYEYEYFGSYLGVVHVCVPIQAIEKESAKKIKQYLLYVY